MVTIAGIIVIISRRTIIIIRIIIKIIAGEGKGRL